jgi:hypothetical protein
MSEPEKKTSGSNPMEAKTSQAKATIPDLIGATGPKTVAEALADAPEKARLAAEREAKAEKEDFLIYDNGNFYNINFEVFVKLVS